MALLTKSKYLNGLQCPKLLWVSVNDKNRLPPVDSATQALFDTGHIVGDFAKKLFPLGVDVPESDFMGNIRRSKELIKERKTIFEAGIMIENLYSRADVLVPVENDMWDIVEVKSSTSVKDVNVSDVAFQKYVYEKAGLKIRNSYLLHINNQYVRNGDVDVKELFTQSDITFEVSEEINLVPERVKKMFQIINGNEPNSEIGSHCNNPYNCAITECWNHIPKNSVFNLYRLGKKAFNLYDEGIINLTDVPEDYKLNDKQRIQKSNKVHVDKVEIKKFLETLEEPLYYLDFETISSAVPMFDGVKPYGQIPFQYSLHIVENENTKHHEFLYDGTKDPRKEFLDSLKENLGSQGSIVVYNQSFEKMVLNALAVMFPEEKEWVESINLRIVDLIIPFRQFHYYNPLQQGSASIKKVLPAMTGKGYEDMEIGDGGTASLEYLNILLGKTTGEKKEKIRESLLKYCELDTKAMLWIKEELEKVVKE